MSFSDKWYIKRQEIFEKSHPVNQYLISFDMHTIKNTVNVSTISTTQKPPTTALQTYWSSNLNFVIPNLQFIPQNSKFGIQNQNLIQVSKFTKCV